MSALAPDTAPSAHRCLPEPPHVFACQPAHHQVVVLLATNDLRNALAAWSKYWRDAKAACAGKDIGTWADYLKTAPRPGVMFLAKSLESLARASKTNVDFLAAAEKRAAEAAKREAATAVETVARERGLSAGVVSAIKAEIFGVKS